jgi:hypothetical protein
MVDITVPVNDQQIKSRLIYIYDMYRTAALNRIYYGRRLDRYQRLNFWAEVAIALGTTTGSGGIAGLAIWGTLPGSYVWLSISGLATVLGVLKPVLQMGKTIENYTKLYAGYTNIYTELKSVVEDISVEQAISEKSKEKYIASKQLVKELGGIEDVNPSTDVIRNIQGEVNRLIPVNTLWVPV